MVTFRRSVFLSFFFTFCLQRLCNGTKFGVPFLTKASRERLFQEAVERQMQLPAFFAAALADSPTVVIEADCPVAEGLFPDGIEGAADGLHEGVRGEG